MCQALRNKRVFIILSSVLAIVICLSYLGISFLNYQHNKTVPVRTSMERVSGEGVVAGDLYGEKKIQQSLPTEENMVGLQLKFATYTRINSGEVNISVVGEQSGRCYYSDTHAAESFWDNHYFDILFFEEVQSAEDSSLLITLQANSPKEKCTTLWASSQDKVNGKLTYSGKVQNGDLFYNVIIQNERAAAPFFSKRRLLILFCFLLISCCLAMTFVQHKNQRNPQKIDFHIELLLGIVTLIALLRNIESLFYPIISDGIPCYFNSLTALFLLGFLLILALLLRLHLVYTIASTTFLISAVGGGILSLGVKGEIVRSIIYGGIILLSTAAFCVTALRKRKLPKINSILFGFGALLGALSAGFCVEQIRDLYYHDGFIWAKWIFFSLVLFDIIIGIKICRRKDENILPKLFLLCALSLGCYIAVFAPIGGLVCWDDQIHYYRVAQLEQGNVAYVSYADNAISERSLLATTSQQEIEKTQLFLLLADQKISLSVDKDVFSFSWLAYMSQVLGIWIGKILRLPFSFRFFLGEFSNIILYSGVFCYAIQKAKIGKLSLSLIGLIPTGLFLASVYSYDSWVTAFLALGIVYFVNEMQSAEPIKWKNILLSVGFILLGSVPKAVYGFILFVLWIMPSSKFQSKKQHRLYLLGILAAVFVVCAMILIPMISSRAGLNDTRGGADVNSLEQVRYILHNPMQYAKTLLKFLTDYLLPRNSHSYLSFFAYLGGKDYHTEIMMLLVLAASFDMTGRVVRKKEWLRVFFSGIILFCTVCIIASALYISFTPVALSTINGCQPRYLLPLLFPAIILLRKEAYVPLNKEENSYIISERYRTGVFAAMVVFLMLSVWFTIASLWTV